jgi:hypothetical protein
LIEDIDTTRIKDLIRTISPKGQKLYLSVLDIAEIIKPPSKHL